jgi:hypothetical protein
MVRFFLFFFIVFSSLIVASQEPYYTNPVKIPMLLSGSFGELRNNHFHSGIDIKTQGTINIPVYAVAEGYISRIVVSPSGYGKAIYINHDNGTTSVYGHLNKFRPDIEEYVKKIQYDKQSFRVDVPVFPGVFTISKNDKFALSGNSGSSQAPHLHFELRKTQSEEPINPLKLGFIVKDKTPPKIFALQISPLTGESHVNYSNKKIIYNVELVDGKYQLKNNSAIPVYGEIGFAIESNDYFDETNNKCGFTSMKLTIDDVIYSVFEINRFSFNESRKINSYIDYEEYSKSKRKFQRTWLEPCSGLSNFEFTENNGIFDPGIGSVHTVKIILEDANKNESVLEFLIESKYREMQADKTDYAKLFVCGQTNFMETEEFSINLPKDALYANLEFQYKKKDSQNKHYSAIHEIHNESAPLNKRAAIKMKTKNVDKQFQDKLLLVEIDPETGKYSAAGGKYENGWVNAEISTFGTYAVEIDTVPPKINPLITITEDKTLADKERLRFKISDDLSGIEKIEGLMDGKWVLFEYDAKNDLITHYFDATRFDLNKQHQFSLTITDYSGNSSVYEASFFR